MNLENVLIHHKQLQHAKRAAMREVENRMQIAEAATLELVYDLSPVKHGDVVEIECGFDQGILFTVDDICIHDGLGDRAIVYICGFRQLSDGKPGKSRKSIPVNGVDVIKPASTED